MGSSDLKSVHYTSVSYRVFLSCMGSSDFESVHYTNVSYNNFYHARDPKTRNVYIIKMFHISFCHARNPRNSALCSLNTTRRRLYVNDVGHF